MLTRAIGSGLMVGSLVVAACSSPTSPAGPLTASPAAASVAASAPTARSEERKITHDGRDRSHLIYAPPSLDRSKPAPLVIYLHGSGGTATGSELETQLNVQAERQRFFVIYPQGLGKNWNHGCCNESFAHKVDDLGLVREIVKRTAVDHAVDPDRIYVAGFSAGAAMAYRIACETPELVAAIGAISGNLRSDSDCAPRADVSILEIHGTKDTQSPYGGCSPSTTPCPGAERAGVTLPPVEQTNARLREIFGCPKPSVDRNGAVTTAIASPCRGGTEVTLITAEGGIHPSPLGSATGGSVAGADVPALLKFFFAHRRAPAR